MGWLDDVSDFASGAVDATTSAASGAWDATTSAVSDAGSAIADTAVSAYEGANAFSDAASGYIKEGEHAVMDGVRWVEDGIDHGSHALAAQVADVPILGSVAEGAADAVTFMGQVSGGAWGGATSLIGGAANAIVNPLDTVMALETMAEHTGGPLGQTLRFGHGLVDMATGDRGFGDVMDATFNPMREAEENGRYWSNVGSAFLAPYKESIDQGRYGEVVGRGGFDLAMLLSGVGEVEGAGLAAEGAEAARVAEAAEAARVAEAAEAARVAEAAEAARVAEAAEAARAAEAAEAARAAEAADAARAAEAADAARAAEAADGARVAEGAGGGGGAATTTGGPGGGGPKYHAVYDDGALVTKADRPPRLGEAVPDPAAQGAHSRLRWDTKTPGRNGGTGRVYQAREFDAAGNPVRDIDFTSPTYPNGRPRTDHLPPPHQHPYIPNGPGGKGGYQRGPGEPFVPPTD
ncbi:MAG: hypothetical protein AB7T06_21245 [Kofleriaceae bacterium]